MKKNKILLGLMAVVAMVGFQSCSDEKYDVVGNPNKLIYFAPSGSVDNLPNPSQKFTVVSTPVGYFGDDIVAEFGFKVTRPLSANGTVTVKIDNDLVADYNNEHDTKYAVCEGATLEKATASFKAGEYVSTDSVKITYSTESFEKLTEKAYLIPVRISSTTEGVAAETNGVAYVLINLETKLVKDGASENDIKYAKLEKAGWSVTSTDANASNLDKIVDGDTGTNGQFSVGTPTYIVDMAATHKVQAFDFNVRTGYYGYSNVAMEYSVDGTNWEQIGSVPCSYANHHLVVLYGAVDARYLKVTPTFYYGNYAGWGYCKTYELDVYGE